MSFQSLIGLHRENGPAIFSRSLWREIRDLDEVVGAKYDKEWVPTVVATFSFDVWVFVSFFNIAACSADQDRVRFRMRRRQFLTVSAASLGGLLVFSLDRKGSLIPTGDNQLIRIPLRFFYEDEALIVKAAASRIFPSDDSGPGANEANVVIYIDRQLAGPYGRDCYRYTKGPFENGPPDLGYQGKATPREIYRKSLKTLKGFDRLAPAEQDNRLKEIESTEFFSLLRQHTIEGMFCDPMHGGNRDMVGWQLIGFPGPYMGYYADVDKHFGVAFRPKPIRLSGGHPMEDERCTHPTEDEE